MRAGDDVREVFEIYGMAQVHYKHFFAGGNLFLEFVGKNAGDAQAA